MLFWFSYKLVKQEQPMGDLKTMILSSLPHQELMEELQLNLITINTKSIFLLCY